MGKAQKEKRSLDANEVMALTLARYAVKTRAQARFLREQLADVSNLILTRWLFLRLLALIYLVAFLSFWQQCDGLIGPNGILPAAETLDRIQAAANQAGHGLSYAVFNVPTLCWFGDGYVSPVLCLIGVVASLVVMTGFAQPLGFFVMWVCYLSVTQVGWLFTGHAGDRLLLEAGFLAIFFAPWVWEEHTTHEPRPSDMILVLYRWLLFRVVLGAALAQFADRDGLWYPSFGALALYFQSQPLPSPAAWYLHHLPEGLHRMGTAVLLGAEILLPLVIFSSRQLRIYGCGGIIILQVLAVISGNAGLYNWLIMVLAVLLLDDEILPLRWRGKWCAGVHLVRSRPWHLAQNAMHGVLCLSILSVTVVHLIRQIEGAVQHDPSNVLFQGPAVIAGLDAALSPFGIVSGYGMPMGVSDDRLALVVEGSVDGEAWLPYTFAHHHGPVGRPPGWIAPFHPRLDWELARGAAGSLKDPRVRRWFVPFLVRLLEGEHAVLDLLGANPFPDQPPRYLRVLVYRYEFTSGGERRSTGAWWRRSLIRVFCPPVTLDRLLPVLELIQQSGAPESVAPED